VTEDEVAVQILATDEDPAREEVDPRPPHAVPGDPTDPGDRAKEPGPGIPVADAARLPL
jgi:hypothetical protein